MKSKKIDGKLLKIENNKNNCLKYKCIYSTCKLEYDTLLGYKRHMKNYNHNLYCENIKVIKCSYNGCYETVNLNKHYEKAHKKYHKILLESHQYIEKIMLEFIYNPIKVTNNIFLIDDFIKKNSIIGHILIYYFPNAIIEIIDHNQKDLYFCRILGCDKCFKSLMAYKYHCQTFKHSFLPLYYRYCQNTGNYRNFNLLKKIFKDDFNIENVFYLGGITHHTSSQPDQFFYFKFTLSEIPNRKKIKKSTEKNKIFENESEINFNEENNTIFNGEIFRMNGDNIKMDLKEIYDKNQFICNEFNNEFEIENQNINCFDMNYEKENDNNNLNGKMNIIETNLRDVGIIKKCKYFEKDDKKFKNIENKTKDTEDEIKNICDENKNVEDDNMIFIDNNLKNNGAFLKIINFNFEITAVEKDKTNNLIFFGINFNYRNSKQIYNFSTSKSSIKIFKNLKLIDEIEFEYGYIRKISKISSESDCIQVLFNDGILREIDLQSKKIFEYFISNCIDFTGFENIIIGTDGKKLFKIVNRGKIINSIESNTPILSLISVPKFNINDNYFKNIPNINIDNTINSEENNKSKLNIYFLNINGNITCCDENFRYSHTIYSYIGVTKIQYLRESGILMLFDTFEGITKYINLENSTKTKILHSKFESCADKDGNIFYTGGFDGTLSISLIYKKFNQCKQILGCKSNDKTFLFTNIIHRSNEYDPHTSIVDISVFEEYVIVSYNNGIVIFIDKDYISIEAETIK